MIGTQDEMLKLYFSEDLLENNWSEHPFSGSILSNQIRNAGPILSYKNKLLRFTQDCTTNYGDKIIIKEIMISQLHYSEKIINECINNEMLNSFIEDKLIYYKSTTQENSEYTGRITNNIQNKSFFIDLKLNDLNFLTDCAMICGSLDFNNELKNLLIEKGFQEGATNKPNTFVLEKAFVG